MGRIPPKKVLIVQSSLAPTSRTILIAQLCGEALRTRSIESSLFDLRNADLDIYDGRADKEYGSPTQEALSVCGAYSLFILCMPVYSRSASGTLKNFLLLTKDVMCDASLGLICHTTGEWAYPATVELKRLIAENTNAKTLLPIVFTSEDDFSEGRIDNLRVQTLFDELMDSVVKHAHAIS